MLVFGWQQYSIDQTFGRVSEPLTGWASDGSSDAGASEDYSEEETGEESADEEEE